MTKLLASALFLAAAAFAIPASAQQNSDGAVQSFGIRKSTPAPSPGASVAKAPAGPKKPLDAVLCKDKGGKGTTTTFAATDAKIYLHYTDDGAAKGDKLRVVWVAEDAAGLSKNKKLTETAATMTGPGATGDFYLPAAGSAGFPAGKYHVDLYNGDKLAKSLKFTVTK